MNDALRLRRGAFMRRGGAVWRVKVLLGEEIHLENPDTGAVDRITLVAWERGCFDNLIQMVEDPTAHVDPATAEVTSVAVSDMRKKMGAEAARIGSYMEAYRDPYGFYRKHYPQRPAKEMNIPRSRSKRSLRPFLLDVAAAIGDRKAPGATTLCGWLGKIAKAGGDDHRAATPRFDKRGPQQRYMDVMVQRWLDEIINTEFLNSPSVTRKDVFEALDRKVRKWNEQHPDDQLPMVKVRQISRYIAEEIQQETYVARRFGQDYADEIFRSVQVVPEEAHILDVVECDHTGANITLLDDATDMVLGSPWISIAFDRRSRLILGGDIHFEGPTLGAVFRTLKSCMSPKDFPKDWGLEQYLVYGVPVRFFFDKGADWDNNHIREVSQTMDVGVDYEPAGCPELKGKIERFNRTMKEAVVHPMGGGKPSAKRPGFVRDGEAFMYVSEFKKRFWRWATTVHPYEPHSVLKDTPMNVWLKGKAARPIRPLRKKDDLRILMTRVEMATPSKSGVRFGNLRWKGDVIKEIMTHPGWTRYDGKVDAKIGIDLAAVGKVKLRINEENLAHAWVTHPISRKMVRLQPSMPDYMEGLTMHQHILAQRIVEQYMDGQRTESNLLRAKELLHDEARAILARKSSRLRDRARAARVLEKKIAEPASPVSEAVPDTVPAAPIKPNTRNLRSNAKVVRRN